MSGGFFRGTSADQDTRFSNKQAKLLKTQKFPPELDHLVDTTKVKMDVMKPWIAKRVTEMLGFEDEVLINFVYGLLEAKEVDGKQIQIQLTGFMEKNTGKFMKELWALLLSAQKNASGVPQQFLDEKEEEMKKKKAESERITQEIQKRQERGSQDASQMSLKGMDGEAETAKPTDAASPGPLKHSVGRADASKPDDERETDGRRDSRRSRQKSPSYDSDGKSPVSLKGAHAVTKSRSRSFSRSRSYSGDGRRSRDGSRSPSPVKRPRSRERGRRQTPPRYTLSPRRRRSPYAKRRSPPRLHHRSPSPIRRRSPVRLHRRSPSPRRRRSSPFNRRSRSPLRRRSPLRPHRHRRSPSPLRRKSPMRRRRSPSPKQQRISSKYSPKHHDPDLQRNPAVRRSRSPSQSRSSLSREASVSAEEAEYGPGKTGVDLPPSQSSRDDDRKRPHRVGEAEGLDDRRRPIDPDTEEKSRGGRSEKRPRKSDQRETSLEDESDDDSEEERRLESKRRKKEERRLRKEEKQRRREERHRKREERRAQKKSEGDDGFRNPSGGGSTEETENEQKKLEIELRQKALESLRAKKAVNP